MQISQNSVVCIHYTLTDDAGEVIDSSSGGEPLAYLHGAGNIIPGLENALAGKQVGDKLKVHIDPAQGYGERNPELIQDVPRRAFQGVDNIAVGMTFHAQSSQGPMQVTVTRVAGDMVTVDGNHALAGVALNFDVEVTDVRAASEEELSHGHVHGPGGHHH
ncbi:peptidylprolyl isomerase [Sinimarinibacterium sp. NLF-5-8]|uniref:FKBP-type peptidyl-prolyl cis-trans isomerase n=1 Tax=Sinimarinibacterium sp. NLF-5-8 TaxID=2698684 RepID=UPI00137C3E95|nr:peptidylprolyl isomerase [Sinimarinibacterium sp. NLF-5-8]QHS10829.1 peptidylprolyl isomerase [Sinimarinibacterium sp. NLF-5-8]